MYTYSSLLLLPSFSRMIYNDFGGYNGSVATFGCVMYQVESLRSNNFCANN